jgi:hypothetical protein
VVDIVYREIFWGSKLYSIDFFTLNPPFFLSCFLLIIVIYYYSTLFLFPIIHSITRMVNSSDGEADSRTALVGAPRTRPSARSTSRSASHDSNSRPTKRQRRHRNKKESDLADFVPRGGAFTAHSLPVDPDSTSSSGSSSSSSENSDSDENSDTAAANPHAGNTAPAISWNQGRKAAVRTTLGKRSVPTKENTAQFEAVNDKYWRSRSGSASSAAGEDKPSAKEPSQEDELEEGEIDSRSESDDSDSLGSEADDSILLNIGEKMGMDGANDYSPADLAQQHRNDNNISQATGSGLKEEAFRLFSSKYPNAPTALVDLSQEDLEILAKYVYFDRNIHDIDLKLPISCIECHSEGHLADVCPAKEVCSSLSFTRFHITNLSPYSVHTVAPGISIRAVSVLAGDDAYDALNEAMMSQVAPQSYAKYHGSCLVATATATAIISKANAPIYGSSQFGIYLPIKSQYQSPVQSAAAQSTW